MQLLTPVARTPALVPATADQPVAERLTPLFVYDAIFRGRNENTRRAYHQAYTAFARFINAVDSTGDPDPRAALTVLCGLAQGPANALAAGWRNHMLDTGLARATVKTRMGALRSFVTEAYRLGVVAWQLIVKTRGAKPLRNTAGPGFDAYKAMLAKAAEAVERPPEPGERKRNPRKALRDVAILRLLHDNGLRRSEVEGVDWPRDVDVRLGRVQVVGKGDGTDATWVTVPARGMEAIRRWVEARGDHDGPLFVNLDHAAQNAADGRRLSDHAIYVMVCQYGAAVGRRVSPHKLRHGGITRAVKVTNGDANKVRLFARHARMDTTQIYIDNDRDLAGEVARGVAEDD